MRGTCKRRHLKIPVDSFFLNFRFSASRFRIKQFQNFLDSFPGNLETTGCRFEIPEPFGRMESFVHLMSSGKLRDLLMFHHLNGRKLKSLSFNLQYQLIGIIYIWLQIPLCGIYLERIGNTRGKRQTSASHQHVVSLLCSNGHVRL